MTPEQWMVAGIAMLIIAWITDKDLIAPILDFPWSWWCSHDWNGTFYAIGVNIMV